MTQAERDRLVALQKAKKKLITQREAAGGSGGAGLERSAGKTAALRDEKTRGRGGDSWITREAVEPTDGGELGKGGGEDPDGACLPRIRTDVGGGISQGETPDRGEQRDGASVDDSRQAVAGEGREGDAGASLAATAEPVWRIGAVGYQRTRLAGRAGRKAVLDRNDR